ncbi:hypothetical protein MRB53_027895 [Persea americana]|uniref:Uncharacterized protein n=1 Tax=Persea americana TaxID=3435 RepID=A0ACC2KE62_PERAE|nr:hypothetical protein MRB53_027895 [Persea americana]
MISVMPPPSVDFTDETVCKISDDGKFSSKAAGFGNSQSSLKKTLTAHLLLACIAFSFGILLLLSLESACRAAAV